MTISNQIDALLLQVYEVEEPLEDKLIAALVALELLCTRSNMVYDYLESDAFDVEGMDNYIDTILPPPTIH
jgi:hypothetical protein